MTKRRLEQSIKKTKEQVAKLGDKYYKLQDAADDALTEFRVSENRLSALNAELQEKEYRENLDFTKLKAVYVSREDVLKAAEKCKNSPNFAYFSFTKFDIR